MHKIKQAAASLLFCAILSASLPSSAQIEYDWSTTPDFNRLRKEIGWANDFSEKCETARPKDELIEKLGTQQWESAIQIGLSWLSQCPVDLRVHLYTGLALENSGNKQEAGNHFRWAKGLMESISSSGDGLTADTAYVTISIAEEYDVMIVLGLEPQEKGLIMDPVPIDVFTATNTNGEEVTVFFYPEAHVERLAKFVTELEPDGQ